MEKLEIIKNIAKRSGGDIYLGVVGAVRTGKSTFFIYICTLYQYFKTFYLHF